MLIRTRYFVVGLSLLILGYLPTAQADLPDPLREVILEAINTNPEVQSRWFSFLAAEQGRKAARGGYWPEVDVELSASRQYQDSRDFGRVDRDPLAASLTLRQMLYDGFFTRADVARMGHTRMVRYFELLDAAEQTAVEAIKAYADVERYRELVFLAEQNYNEHLEIYQQIEELAGSGVGRGVDLEQSTGRLALAESNLLTEIANLHDVSQRFLRVVGREPPDDYIDMVGAIPSDALPETIQEALVDALIENPTLLASVENLLSAQQQVRAGRSAYHPRLDFLVTSQRDNTPNNFFNTDGDETWVTDTTVGLVLSMNLFRGFADQARVGQFVAEAGQATDQRENVCRSIRQALIVAYNDIRVLDEKLIYLDQYQLSTDRVRTAYRQQFLIGNRTLLDLLDIENEFFEARRSYVEAQFDREIATTRALAGMGRLLSALELTRDQMPDISERPEIDPDAICPPIAVQMLDIPRDSMFRR